MEIAGLQKEGEGAVGRIGPVLAKKIVRLYSDYF
jgi:hypothetical protein